MTRSARGTASLLASLSLLAACARGGEKADSGDSGATAATTGAAATAAAAAGVGGGSTIRVTLTGGPLPGTHEKQHDSPTCTVGYAKQGAWGNAASDLEDKEGLVGIDMIVDDPAAAKSGTDKFMATVYVNDRLDPKNQITIDPRNNKGTGTVTIDDKGSTARVTIKGKSAAGVGVDATIDCQQIMRA